MRKILLNNGFEIPEIGFGSFPQKKELIESVKIAYDAGYRLFDTSDNYFNEEFLGNALLDTRGGTAYDLDKIKVVSKFSQPYRTFELEKCFLESEGRLYGKVDIYLLHWPYPFLWKQQWRRMEKLYLQGKCRAIGVCNFEVPKLKQLMKFCKVPPTINQVERHPLFQQNDIVEYCKNNNIQVMSYSPVARFDNELLDSQILRRIAKKHSKNVVQVALRWNMDTGTIPVPGSRSEVHITENINVFDFALDIDDIEKIESMESGKRIRYNPNTRFSKIEKLKFLIMRIILLFIPEHSN